MLKRMVSVLLLFSLLWSCNGGDGGSGKGNGQSSEKSDLKNSQEVGSKSDQERATDTSVMSLGEIRKDIDKAEKAIKKLGFAYNQDDDSIEMINIKSRYDVQNPPIFKDGQAGRNSKKSFVLLPWRYYCSHENNILIFEDDGQDIINNCADSIFERYEKLVKQLKNIEFLEKTLLENKSRELSNSESLYHLGKLKLTINVRKRIEAFQRYHQEQTKMTYRTLDELSGMSFERISSEDVLVITDDNQDIYNLHLMAKRNDPKISKMAKKKKLFLYSDWLKSENYGHFDSFTHVLKIYVTDLFVYIKPIQNNEIPELRYGQAGIDYTSRFDVASQESDNNYGLIDNSRWE